MDAVRDDVPYVHVASRQEWRAWLAANHTTETAVWLVQWRPATGRPQVPYDDVVEEALCFGWVDSTARTLDEERSALYVARRRKGSTWARTNKDRVARLERAGLMEPAGLAAVEQAKADGSWTILDSVEALEVPEDLAAALAERPEARSAYEALPAGVRKRVLYWLVSAKRSETRARRVAETVRALAEEGRAPSQAL